MKTFAKIETYAYDETPQIIILNLDYITNKQIKQSTINDLIEEKETVLFSEFTNRKYKLLNLIKGI